MVDSRKKPQGDGFQLVLLLSTFVVATCGLIYELIAGTLASYLLGDSVRQFSYIIGVYLFSMGVGSMLSQYLKDQAAQRFVEFELLIGLVGGLSPLVLFYAFAQLAHFSWLLYFLLFLTGVLVGLEIPLIMFLLKARASFEHVVSRILSFDYIGALAASVVFPTLLMPRLGLVRTSLLFGLLNTVVGLLLTYYLAKDLRRLVFLRLLAILIGIGLLALFVQSPSLERYLSQLGFNEQVLLRRKSKYQEIVLAGNRGEVRLYLNRNLQFSSRDEYRYHEALVFPVVPVGGSVKTCLVLGGGDGLAVRELLRYEGLESVTLVDLDEQVTQLFAQHPLARQLNGESLSDPRVKVLNQDAFRYVRQCQERFDAIVIDFPDPANYSLGKLYSLRFFRQLARLMKPGTRVAMQSTSPFYAKRSYWCIHKTLCEAGFQVLPYHVNVPSFGEWGFMLFSKSPLSPRFRGPGQPRFMTQAVFRHATVFPPDMRAEAQKVNTLNNQRLVQLFNEEWGEF